MAASSAVAIGTAVEGRGAEGDAVEPDSATALAPHCPPPPPPSGAPAAPAVPAAAATVKAAADSSSGSGSESETSSDEESSSGSDESSNPSPSPARPDPDALPASIDTLPPPPPGPFGAPTARSSVCGGCGKAARYTCPRCGARTCSVACVRQHKAKQGCNGKRDRTAFISKAAFDDNGLINDYVLLEDTNRVAQTAKRVRQQGTYGGARKPGHLVQLARHATSRGVTLHLLPSGMERRKRNTTSWHGGLKVLRWHVDVCYQGISRIDSYPRIRDDVLLSDILDRALNPSKSPGGGGGGADLGEDGDRPLYHRIESIQSTLADVLKGRAVVEYPTFHLSLNPDAFPIAPPRQQPQVPPPQA